MPSGLQKTETYSQEQDIKNTQRMRKVLKELPKFCRSFFRSMEDTVSARTRLAYAYDLRVFFEYLQHENESLSKMKIHDYPLDVLNRIGREDIEEYMEYLSYYTKNGRIYTNDEKGKSRKLSALRKMFHYFYAAELIDRDVSALVPLPKRHEKAIVRLDSGEVRTLLDQVEDGTSLTKSQRKYHEHTKTRDVAILTLMLGTGIRVSECVGLDLSDINFRDHGIRVHRKGGNDAIVYFGEEVSAALKEYLEVRQQIIPKEGHENALFLSIQNRRITVRAVENLVKKYASLVTTIKKITPHKLRSTYGTSLYRATGDIYLVADVLGHSDVNTTRRHYAAIEEDRRRAARDIVHLRDDPEAESSEENSSDKKSSEERSEKKPERQASDQNNSHKINTDEITSGE